MVPVPYSQMVLGPYSLKAAFEIQRAQCFRLALKVGVDDCLGAFAAGIALQGLSRGRDVGIQKGRRAAVFAFTGGLRAVRHGAHRRCKCAHFRRRALQGVLAGSGDGGVVYRAGGRNALR